MIVDNCKQRSERWFELRLGRPTASNFGKIVKFDKDKGFKPRVTVGRRENEKAREDYKWQLVFEKLTGIRADDNEYVRKYQNALMERGEREEPAARASYAEKFGAVEEVGFVMTDDKKLGCSPDGFVSNRRGLVEIKCQAPWHHLATVCLGHSDDYMPQVMGQMLICETDYVDLFSWHEYWPDEHTRYPRNDWLINQLKGLLYTFVAEVEMAYADCLRLGCRPTVEAAA